MESWRISWHQTGLRRPVYLVPLLPNNAIYRYELIGSFFLKNKKDIRVRDFSKKIIISYLNFLDAFPIYLNFATNRINCMQRRG